MATPLDPVAATANAMGDIDTPAAHTANYLSSADWNGLDGNVTSVGSAGVLSESFYGTSDQSGNVSEWTEGLFSEEFPLRMVRGGSGNRDSQQPLVPQIGGLRVPTSNTGS